MSVRNYSTGLRIYCADRKKMIQECKNPITEGDFKWIFACNCEGTEQLRSFLIISLNKGDERVSFVWKKNIPWGRMG